MQIVTFWDSTSPNAQPLRNKVEHSERRVEVPLFLDMLQCYDVDVVKSRKGKNDFLLKVIYITFNQWWAHFRKKESNRATLILCSSRKSSIKRFCHFLPYKKSAILGCFSLKNKNFTAVMRLCRFKTLHIKAIVFFLNPSF